MLTIDVGRLEREKTLEVNAHVPSDDPLFDESEIVFSDGITVEMVASVAGSGEFLVTGSVRGTLKQQCRRCLKPIETGVERQLTLVYAPNDELNNEDDGETRSIGPRTLEIDLGRAIREELILDTPRFAACDVSCRGLCPRCGVDLNNETCDCVLEEPDPRWDALRALKRD